MEQIIAPEICGHIPSDKRAEGPSEELSPAATTGDADLSLFEAFLDLRQHCRGALVALSDRLMVTNQSASDVLEPSDRPRLWASAQEALNGGNTVCGAVALSNGTSVRARYRPIVKAGVPVGALVQFSVPSPGHRYGARSASSAVPIPGWSELTNAERVLAEVIARGLTNREAGKRIFVSRHTVDAHLRSIFRKLGISSRVELARLVGEHFPQLSSAGDGPQRLFGAPGPVHQMARSA